MARALSLRWIPVSVFIFSSSLNFLDRQLLNTLAPLILADFHLNQTGFGFIVSVFSFTYAASSLVVGWLLDRFGVNRAMPVAVTWWSWMKNTSSNVTGVAWNCGVLITCPFFG